ncbi:MAG: flagellar biosynthesis protein FlgE [Geobacteraceae bacterium GWB2_52_12]|nr:MAG: flagellar biosynthesis protein FlgE [Geobacteraceae bacterium GWB2_52_12]
MSVTSAMFTGVSGLLANAEGINVIGNNLANVNTVGFKGGRMLFSDLLSANIGNDSQIGRGTQIQKVENIFGQGSFETTESVTDLALQGNSFFALKAPTIAAPVNQNSAFLSRAGAFHVDSSLNLVNPNGYQVLDTAGNPIQFLNTGLPANVATDFSKIVSVSPDGLISYLARDGATTMYYNASGVVGVPVSVANAATVQRVAVVTAPDVTGLTKAGGTLFTAGSNSGIPAAAFTLVGNQANGISEKIFSNSLEQSNVDMAGQFVKMILTQRAYSANSKTITTADEMTQEALNLKR